MVSACLDHLPSGAISAPVPREDGPSRGQAGQGHDGGDGFYEKDTGEAVARHWMYLTSAIAAEVTAALSLKAALTFPVFGVVVVVGYITAFALLSKALRAGMPLGVAYGIWGASGVALTAIFSRIVFGEPLTLLMGVGILIVVGGVLCVELGSQKAQAGAPA